MSSPVRSNAQGESRWYPSSDQLKDPATTARAMKQVLDQFYSLQDRHDKLQTAHTELKDKVGAGASTGASGGPANSMLCGLRVAPVDSSTLANGATLKFNKLNGHFEFV